MIVILDPSVVIVSSMVVVDPVVVGNELGVMGFNVWLRIVILDPSVVFVSSVLPMAVVVLVVIVSDSDVVDSDVGFRMLSGGEVG